MFSGSAGRSVVRGFAALVLALPLMLRGALITSGLDESASGSAFVAGREIEPLVFTVAEGCKATATGLPAGLKLAGAVGGPYRIQGTPTARPGTYQVKLTLVQGSVKEFATVALGIENRTLALVLAAGEGFDSEGCTVKGGGLYPAGKKVTLTATPAKEKVFAGWFEDEACRRPCADFPDHRMPSGACVTTADDRTLYAKFVPGAADAGVAFKCRDEWYVDVDGEGRVSLPFECASVSCPKITASGLPSGVKLEGSSLVAADVRKVKCGYFPVKLTAVNASKVKAEFLLTVCVGRKDWTRLELVSTEEGRYGTVKGAGYYAPGAKVTLKATARKGYVFAGWDGLTDQVPDLLNPGITFTNDLAQSAEVRAEFIPISEDHLSFNEWFYRGGSSSGPSSYPWDRLSVGEPVRFAYGEEIRFDTASLVTLSVKGLPAGLKYDAKSRTILGTPTKAGRFFVTLNAVNAGGYKYTKILRMCVGEVKDDDYDEISAWYGHDFDYGAFRDLEMGVSCDVWVASTDLALTVKNLPAGLSLVKDGSDLYLRGTPVKAGVYSVLVSLNATKDQGRLSARRTIVVDGGESRYLSLEAGPGGTVSGMGVYAAGATAKAVAKPAPGYVFAGWYELDGHDADAEPIVGTLVETPEDYRNATCQQIMGADAYCEMYARFVPAQENRDHGISVTGLLRDDSKASTWYLDPAYSDDARYYLVVDSLSCPKVSVTGLPAGVVLAKEVECVRIPWNAPGRECHALVVSDRTKLRPGVYTVTVTAENLSKAKGAWTFQIEILNIEDDIFRDIDYDSEANRVAANTRVRLSIAYWDDFSNPGTISVSGLPAGMKYSTSNYTMNDMRFLYLTGTPTKPGAYTVTLTVRRGRETHVATLTINVEPLPSWLVGTYEGETEPLVNGMGDLQPGLAGPMTVTVSEKGVISGKIKAGTQTVSFTGDIQNDEGLIDAKEAESSLMKVKYNGTTCYVQLRFERRTGPGGISLGRATVITGEYMGYFCHKEETGVLDQNLWRRGDVSMPNLAGLTCDLGDGYSVRLDAAGNALVARSSWSTSCPLAYESFDGDEAGLGTYRLSFGFVQPVSGMRARYALDVSVDAEGVQATALRVE